MERKHQCFASFSDFGFCFPFEIENCNTFCALPWENAICSPASCKYDVRRSFRLWCSVVSANLCDSLWVYFVWTYCFSEWGCLRSGDLSIVCIPCEIEFYEFQIWSIGVSGRRNVIPPLSFGELWVYELVKVVNKHLDDEAEWPSGFPRQRKWTQWSDFVVVSLRISWLIVLLNCKWVSHLLASGCQRSTDVLKIELITTKKDPHIAVSSHVVQF